MTKNIKNGAKKCKIIIIRSTSNSLNITKRKQMASSILNIVMAKNVIPTFEGSMVFTFLSIKIPSDKREIK
jgi:hypothetical protein